MESAYAAIYPDLYRRHWWWRVREEILLDRIARALEHADSPARILDVGCGAGLFFDALSRFGEVEGIESEASTVAHAGRWRSRIHLGELDAAFPARTPYDAVLMLDVLEHVPDPLQLLGHAARLLKPHGRIIVTVPAFNWLWTAHDDMNHHLRRYTAAELRRTLVAAGLHVEQSTYLFQSLVVAKLLVRAREAAVGAREGGPGIPGEPLNTWIQRWFRAEFSVAGWLPFGGSVLAVARLRA